MTQPIEVQERFGVPRREWSSKCNTFNVQVVQHFRDVSATQEAFKAQGWAPDDGGWRWNVYAFIFPSHPAFAKFNPESDSFYQDVIAGMPFHSGASYIRRHFDHLGRVTCFQVGSDYNHLGDDRFTFMDSVFGAERVFADAIDLIRYLETYQNENDPQVSVEPEVGTAASGDDA